MAEKRKFVGKSLYIAEKPSVAREFARALKEKMANCDGYMEGTQAIVTWCVGHLVTMSYPEVYDEKYRRWRLDTLPFLPKQFKYEVIESAAKQYKIVAHLLNRPDVDTIYVCTDSGREGEYIYRLVEQMAGVKGKERRRVWIDSQTEEEILRGIREAKDLSVYDHLADAAYLRAKEDYLMGINFSRLLTIKYGNTMAGFLNEKYSVISVGRVMTCVLGMVVRREREIRTFVKTPFYRVVGEMGMAGVKVSMEWKSVHGSRYENSPLLYKENGFKEKADAIHLIEEILEIPRDSAVFDLPKNVAAEQNDAIRQQNSREILSCEKDGVIHKIEKKKEKKNPPLLYNLAELQNDCSKFFKISPDETLAVVQELYEKKLVTYPRTDARVLSAAVAKEITKNISGLQAIPGMRPFAEEILKKERYRGLEKTRYVNDKQITDHYAIIPTGQGIHNLSRMSSRGIHVYETIVRRFLAIFYPAAVYEKIALTVRLSGEYFFANEKYLKDPGYLAVMDYSFRRQRRESAGEDASKEGASREGNTVEGEEEEIGEDKAHLLSVLKKGDTVLLEKIGIKEGETSPPKRYNSGSMILAMENAGQLIEDEELRAQIKGSGIGTSATRAEILKKLVHNQYLALNKKTQIITPTLRGELIYDIVNNSITSLLNPELTASWEKGLTYVAEGSITSEEYMGKLEDFIRRRTGRVLSLNNQYMLAHQYRAIAPYYQKGAAVRKAGGRQKTAKKESGKEAENGTVQNQYDV